MSDAELLAAIGARIREARKRAGLTQARLAELVFVASMSLKNWEAGRTNPGATSVIRLAAVLRVGVGWLLLGDDGG